MASITIPSYDGYHFNRWSTGATENPYTLTIDQDTVITAYFEADGTNGIDEVEKNGAKVMVQWIMVKVSGAEGKEMTLTDAVGRMIYRGRAKSDRVPKTGVYFVRIEEEIFKIAVSN